MTVSLVSGQDANGVRSGGCVQLLHDFPVRDFLQEQGAIIAQACSARAGWKTFVYGSFASWRLKDVFSRAVRALVLNLDGCREY
jgi:hypothetical protein